jgi:hypothetical protein
MSDDNSRLLRDRQFKVFVAQFRHVGSAALSNNHQRIYITPELGEEGCQQLIVQLNERPQRTPEESRPVSGVAQEGDLMVVLLEPDPFFALLDTLYETRRGEQVAIIDIASDDSGEIVRFTIRAQARAEHPSQPDVPAPARAVAG